MLLKILTIGGSKTGFGHIARMIPVYDAFQQLGTSAKFYIQGDKQALSIFEDRNAEFLNWMDGDSIEIVKGDIVLVDTLIPPVEIIERLTHTTKHVYFISDDLHTPKWPFQVINWRIGAAEFQAKNGIYGEEFVPLRIEVLAASGLKNQVEPLKKVVISMGAGDVLNLIPKTVDILKNSGLKVQILVVIRSFHPEYPRLLGMQSSELEILADASAKELFQAVAKCDFAIASGGHSIYEFAYLGIPVIHVRVAENQEPAKCWDNTGFTYPIGMYQETDYRNKVMEGLHYYTYEKLQEASIIGMELIDGQGAQRLCQNLLSNTL